MLWIIIWALPGLRRIRILKPERVRKGSSDTTHFLCLLPPWLLLLYSAQTQERWFQLNHRWKVLMGIYISVSKDITMKRLYLPHNCDFFCTCIYLARRDICGQGLNNQRVCSAVLLMTTRVRQGLRAYEGALQEGLKQARHRGVSSSVFANDINEIAKWKRLNENESRNELISPVMYSDLKHLNFNDGQLHRFTQDTRAR